MNKSTFLKALRIIWNTDKKWFFFNISFTLLMGFAPIFTLWIGKELINAITDLLQDKTISLDSLVQLLIAQFIIIIISSSISYLKEYFNQKAEINLEHTLQKMVLDKVTRVPFTFFDNPEFYNGIQRLHGSKGTRFLAPIQSLLDIAQNIISILSFLVYLYSVHWSLSLLCFLSSIPIFVSKMKLGNQKYWLMYNQTPLAREAMIASNLLSDRQTSKEIRLFQIADYLINRWSTAFIKNSKEQLKFSRKQHLINFGLNGITTLFYTASAIIIIKLIIQRTLKVGDFVAIGQAVQGSQSLINQCSSQLANIYENSLYLKEFFDFMDFQEEITSEPLEGYVSFPKKIKTGIEVQNVCFSYFKSKREALKNVSIHIQPGEKIAVVGENGSGKTTLVKCLLGLYPVTDGKISIDGNNIQRFDKKEMYKNITALFQDFIKYPFTVKENIAFGNINLIDDLQSIKEAAHISGVDNFVQRFKNGYNTYLSRFLYDGEDLSGGQWQKVALARSLISNSQIIILDEPTAALDPKAEMEVFQQFHSLSKNKTTIFISHRMSAAKLADRIVVMKDGEMVEVGTFKELISLNGEFARMYKMQSQFFETENVSVVS